MAVSLNSIEPEVLSLILEYVEDTSPKSIKAVACVNGYLNQMTKFIAHRHKIVELRGDFNHDSKALESLSSWLQDSTILANVKTLTVKGWIEPIYDYEDEDDGDDDEDEYDDDDGDDESDQGDGIPASYDMSQNYSESWRVLATFISQIGKLRRLDWNIAFPIPILVLDALEKDQAFSSLRLFNFRRARPGLARLDDIELRLTTSTALTHFRYDGDKHLIPGGWNLPYELAIRGVIASAPKLEYAGLSLGYYSSTILLDPDETQRYAPLFYKHDKPNASVKQLTLDGYQISKSTLDSWSTIIDLNTLQNIKFSRGIPTLDYFQSAAALLPNLKHLSLNFRPIRAQSDGPEKAELSAAIQDYLSTSSQLQTISLWSWMGIVSLDSILQRHGDTLESLQLREREEIQAQEQTRHVLTLDEIKSIRNSCPRLRDVTFDLNRSHAKLRWDSDTNRNYYEELAKFENLNSVQIYFDVGTTYLFNSALYNHGPHYSFTDNSDADKSDQDDNDSQGGVFSTISFNPPSKKRRLTHRYVRPSRDTDLEAYTKKVWSTIFGARAGGARRLDVKVGEWESKFFQGPRGGNSELQLKRHMIIKPHERDDVDEPTVIVHRPKRDTK